MQAVDGRRFDVRSAVSALLASCGFAQHTPVVVTVVVVEEDGATVDAALSYVERHAGEFEARQAGHGGRAGASVTPLWPRHRLCAAGPFRSPLSGIP